eukprot:Nk52_evm17s2284 gene=Nk52_evmTU17s2284
MAPVFRSHEGFMRINSDTISMEVLTDDEEFNVYLKEIQRAIKDDVHPVLITQGSSGSYFCRNSEGKVLGVFKPKNEEPYGQLNPKWTKWAHKTCCPCCFGRSCLIPNQGYLSEAGASLVDEKMRLNVVPKTKVVHLASTSFYYRRDWFSAFKKNKRLPKKVGSLQLFVNGYKDAMYYLRKEFLKKLSPELQKEFQLQFESLVILDYVTRNTDRGNDNWLIKYDGDIPCESTETLDREVHMEDKERCISPNAYSDLPLNGKVEDGNGKGNEAAEGHVAGDSSTPNNANEDPEGEVEMYYGKQHLNGDILTGQVSASYSNLKQSDSDSEDEEAETPAFSSDSSEYGDGARKSRTGRIKIAAIDNGLSFPFKHPDSWRAYPYHWAWLEQAKIPFSEETCERLLPLVTDQKFTDSLCDDLFKLFKEDKGFDKGLFESQMSVLRGQMINLRKALEERKSPFELVQMPVFAVAHKPSTMGMALKQLFVKTKPWFSWC